ncbi:DEAD/DEAH box helicase [Paraferrimonas sp. SM1919]|uniref:DEAD/DEAH box helicase n=1 Tax=Paraferrimonas sp. SM1919 TaxID=2662263 RepID=UPI0013D6FA12|nr:DEAD/DEAH box helicase [Paraferrimonas sp. SM1919]
MKLRPYQQQSVEAVINHFRTSNDAAVIVLPTGAGKSIVIAELARIARKKVLVLTHVKELVEQNAQKISLLGTQMSIYAAGLNTKDTKNKVVVASIQSAARAPTRFSEDYSLVIIDECHRVSDIEDSQYLQLLEHLRKHSQRLCLLGLTATPYRLDTGWIYQQHYHGIVRSDRPKPFFKCVFELPLRQLIKQGFLTEPKLFDGLSAQYHFDGLQASPNSDYPSAQVDAILSTQGRATRQIVKQIMQICQTRQGCIIFAASVAHANEIIKLLDTEQAALVTSETDNLTRARIISEFKDKQLKYLVNVSVLTTGFDAPHVDFIAILRPTASVSLYQQMVGRGLRLAADKEDCLVIDYAANGFDLYAPEVGEAKPDSSSVPVQVPCPECGFGNTFWGKVDSDGDVIEHFGRRCQGLVEDNRCQFRFRSRICPECGQENDIAARACYQCQSLLVDVDKHLAAVLKQKDRHIFKCSAMSLAITHDKKNQTRLTVTYFDEQAQNVEQHYHWQSTKQIYFAHHHFSRRHAKAPDTFEAYEDLNQLIANQDSFKKPDILILKKSKFGWQIEHAFFDYKGRHQKPTDAF